MTEVLAAVQNLLGSLVSALMFLAFVIKVSLYPLAKWANKGIAENQVLARSLDGEVKRIKKTFKGEEQSELILTLYKEKGYNPFLPLKSTLVLFIQIPIFVMVFVSVSTEGAFQGESFLSVSDVTQPDGLLNLGGSNINVLPLLMFAVSVANLLVMAKLQAMKRSQIITGYFLALFFFLVLYESPAALVIYWTVNILLQWLIDYWLSLRKTKN